MATARDSCAGDSPASPFIRPRETSLDNRPRIYSLAETEFGAESIFHQGSYLSDRPFPPRSGLPPKRRHL